MDKIKHRIIQTNGIQMHIAEAGQGAPVIFCHGFPETGYSWRHQIGPIADAGWHVIVPDQRGYGGTDCPQEIKAYDILNLVADIVGLVQSLGNVSAAIIGNDWGSIVAAHCALLRPDIFKTVCLLSVPYIPRQWGKHPPTEVMRRIYKEKQFYQVYFQEPGVAEAELEKDTRKSLLTMLYSLSGNVPREKRWRYLIEPSERLLDSGTTPETLPDWLSEKDLESYVNDFSRTGFRGGLNWYRNIDRNWRLTAFLTGIKISQPSLFLAGESDPILELYRNFESSLEKSMPNLKEKAILKNVGHWSPQEDPSSVNRHLIEFLSRYGT